MAPQLYGTLALGALQALGGYTGLQRLNQEPVSSYTDDANLKPLLQNQQMYSQRASYGLSPDEQNQFLNQNASQTAGFYRTAADMASGNLGSAISRIGALDRVRGLGNLAQMNAQAKERAMANLSNANSAINRQYNLQTGFDQNYRLQRERALGSAMSSGLNNVASGINFGVMSATPTPQFQNMATTGAMNGPVAGAYNNLDQYGQGTPVQFYRNPGKNYFPTF